ncbi:WhiB family transcriptional regulator [Mycobacteroides abscessus]|nr:WhiB family transcriptional regulator [Mycobacteroides abscessus]
MSSAPSLASLTLVDNREDAWQQRADCRRHDPDIWHEAAFTKQAKAICAQCPVIRDCAAHALRIAALPPHRVNGLWASIDIPLKVESSEYRKLLNHLRYIAATGMQPPTRNRHRESPDHPADQDIAV